MKVAIFGVGALASVIYEHISRSICDEVVLFISDSPESDTFKGIPHISFDSFIFNKYRHNTSIFIAVGPSQMNQKRLEVFFRFKKLGCNFYSYKSPNSVCEAELDENVFISDFASISASAKIGIGTFIWENVVISHDVEIGEFVYISPGSIIGSYVKVSSNSVLGIGSIIKPKVKIAIKSLIGAGTYINENTIEKGVYVPAKAIFLGSVSEKIDISK